MIEKKALFEIGAIKSTNECPKCGSDTTVEYEESLGILCGRRGSTTRCTKCGWSEFSGVMA